MEKQMERHAIVPDGAWGDLGNGYYRNPVLNADYSDPDVIRVEDDFYMVASDFHYMGMQVLRSRDLVNWTLIGKIYDRLDIDPRYDSMDRYAHGSWAPAIRYQAGKFYVYFCTPEEGLYMSSAEKPEGPWTPLHKMKRVKGWADPCPFWDEDGNAYLGHSTVGAGPIIIHRMSADGKELLDDGVIVYVGKIAEGTKIFKRNGYYYLVIPEGGVEIGWQTVLRSGSIYGPYERKVTLAQGATTINGPHQGALVELANGDTWFMHFQSAGAVGRVCHLQPVRWEDDWPIMGAKGEPVHLYAKPQVDGDYPACLPQSTDEFESPCLGLQWQWNHNPVDAMWSLSEKSGALRIKAMAAPGLLQARNTITQKLMGMSGSYLTELDSSGLKDGQRAGLAYLCHREENWIGVVKEGGRSYLRAVTAGRTYHGPELAGGSVVWLGSRFDLEGETRFAFSLDGRVFISFGGACSMAPGFWKGARIALFSYTLGEEGGPADFLRFQYDREIRGAGR